MQGGANKLYFKRSTKNSKLCMKTFTLSEYFSDIIRVITLLENIKLVEVVIKIIGIFPALC